MGFRACLTLLAGLYAAQLSSFAAVTGLIVIVLCTSRLRAAVLLAAGASAYLVAANSVINARIAPQYVGDSIVTELRVAEFPSTEQRTSSFVAQVRDNPWVPKRIRVSWFDAQRTPQFGEVWQLELRLRRPRGSSNPGGFDYEAWLFRERILATAYVVDGPRNRLLAAGQLNGLERLRMQVVDRIDAAVDDTRHAAVLAAISVGARHAVSAEQWRQFAVSGTSHLMAISGLHIGLAAAAGFVVVLGFSALLPQQVCGRQLATLAAVLVALVYATVSGLAVPAQRATLMITLGAAALLRRRELQPYVVIAASAALLAAVDPLATMTPGFQLSFLAVVALALQARQRGRRLRLAAAQLQLFFALLPLTIIIFQRLSLVAPLVNLVVVPVFSFVTVPFTLAGLVGGDWLLRIATASLDLILRGLETVAALPFAAIDVRELAGLERLLLVLPLARVVLPGGWPGRSLAWLGVFALAVHAPQRPPHACVDLSVLDVGQGLAVVVDTTHKTLIYDAGPRYRSGSSAADYVVLPYLRYRGVESVDWFVVSHSDLDHAGGAAAVVEMLRPAQVLVGEADVPGVTGSPCVAGESWTADGIRFEFLWPRASSVRQGNDASCVLQLTAGEHRALISGDIEQGTERALLRDAMPGNATVVVVPHHGSLTSSTPAFVTALAPRVAIVSAGYGNRWNLPDEDVIQRWHAAGAEVINTATSGAVSLRLCEEGGLVMLRRERERRRRHWHE